MAKAPAQQRVSFGDITSPYGDGQAEFFEFGNRLRERSEALGLNAAGVAQKLDVTRGTMARYWHGERMPSAAMLIDLAELLDVDAFWLVRGQDAPVRKHLTDAAEAGWIDVPEYSLLEIDDLGKIEPISVTPMRQDWLHSSLGESSGLWIARLPSAYDALALVKGTPLFCKDHRPGERMLDGLHYLFRINGGIILAPFSFRGGDERAVRARDLGNDEDQYQVVARVVGQLARPI